MFRIAIASVMFLALTLVSSVSLAEDHPGPEKIRELQTHLRALQQGVKQAEDSGSEEAANRFRVQIKKLSAVLERIDQDDRKEHGEEHVTPEVHTNLLREYVKRLHQNLSRTEELGNEEDVERAKAEIKKYTIMLERHEREKEHGEHHGEHREGESREKEAAQIRERIGHIHREITELRRDTERAVKQKSPNLLEPLHKAIRQREEQLHDLMQEMHKYSNHDDHEHGDHEHGKEGHHEEGHHEGEGHHQSAEHQEQVEQFHRRVKALHEAAELLERAGIHDVAHQLHQQAEQMEREVEKHHQEGRQVRELAEALHQTRNELEEMRHQLRRMHEMIEELHHEEFDDDDDDDNEEREERRR